LNAIKKILFHEMFRAISTIKKDGWYPISQKGSHVKMKHDQKEGIIIFPNHGSQEVGKGLEKKILKDAGIKL
jgi:predicted RNA binding protein YcfA (HicA-like mRNA interferase family)